MADRFATRMLVPATLACGFMYAAATAQTVSPVTPAKTLAVAGRTNANVSLAASGQLVAVVWLDHRELALALDARRQVHVVWPTLVHDTPGTYPSIVSSGAGVIVAWTSGAPNSVIRVSATNF